jgi:DNA-binding Lrp family transcriptional regulator
VAEEPALDRKDLDILSALGKLGGKVSAEEMSTLLGIPARTVRYRLQRLRETGQLSFLYAMTHEWKMGLGDGSLVLEATPKGRKLLPDILPRFTWFYYLGSTYGRYNGFLAHVAYALSDPTSVPRTLDLLKEYDLISDHYFLDVIDYESVRGDFTFFDPVYGWNWDWRNWVKSSESCIAQGKGDLASLETNPQPIDHDPIDVHILSLLKTRGKTTFKQLGEEVGLSESQVHRRVQRLEELNIIKGYRWVMPKIEQAQFLYIYFEAKESPECIVSCIHNLPFPKEIMMQSREKYVTRLWISGTEMWDVLRGLDCLTKHMTSFFVQVVHNMTNLPRHISHPLYSAEYLDWIFPVDKTLEDIRRVLEK